MTTQSIEAIAAGLKTDAQILLHYVCRDEGWRDLFYCGGMSVHFRGPAIRLRNLGLIERRADEKLPMYRRTPLGQSVCAHLGDTA